MWSSIEHLKENLNKIALDVHEGSEELRIYDEDDSSVSDRRASHGFAHSKSLLQSPVSNGIDSTQHNPEVFFCLMLNWLYFVHGCVCYG